MQILSAIKTKNAIGATLLVSGCCIGAGMIGLPVMSSLAGFMPSTLAMLFCYIFTTFTGLLLLEATLWFENKVNLLSIVEFALGKVGRLVTWILFLVLFYCLFVAYYDGGGQLFAGILSGLFHFPISREIGIIVCALFVFAITYVGTQLVDGLNRGLLVGLIFSYCMLISFGLSSVQNENLSYINWTSAFGTIPLLLICFGYQNLVPSLTYYLKKNIDTLRFAIIIGNLIPFFIYFLWNFVILGMTPLFSTTTSQDVDMVTTLLQNTSQTASVVFYIKAFSLFALLTSFLPNGITFIDFLKDGLKISMKSQTKEKLFFCSIVLIPPMLFSLYYPHLFLNALGFAGGFIDVLLFGVIPATVVLIGRYKKNITASYRVIGGSVTPVFVLGLSLTILIFKVI